MPNSHGIHHLSAISGDAQRNFDFYSGLLGLRLVKHTVNFRPPCTFTTAMASVRPARSLRSSCFPPGVAGSGVCGRWVRCA